MVDSVSSSTPSVAPVQPASKAPANVELEVGVSMIKKTMDMTSAAMLQLLQGMGIANNIDASA